MSNTQTPSLFGDVDSGLSLTPKERNEANILVIEPQRTYRESMRTCLKSLAFGSFTDVPSHAAGIEKLQERPITHVIFDAKATNMPPKEFIAKALEFDDTLTLIPASFEPNVDDVFDMLIMGAKGYLVKPFTLDTVDASIVSASKGEPIAEAVKNAKDRNEALVAIMMGALDKAATVIRQAQQFETAKREVPKSISHFRRAAGLAQTFAKNGEEGLIEAIEKFCLERSKGPATRLGRLRKRLKKGSPEESTTRA